MIEKVSSGNEKECVVFDVAIEKEWGILKLIIIWENTGYQNKHHNYGTRYISMSQELHWRRPLVGREVHVGYYHLAIDMIDHLTGLSRGGTH